MKLKDAIKTEKQLKDLGFNIESSLIKELNIDIIAHFNNVTCLKIMCRNRCIMSSYNNISNLGYIIKAFVELFELEKEDGFYLIEEHFPMGFVATERRWSNVTFTLCRTII